MSNDNQMIDVDEHLQSIDRSIQYNQTSNQSNNQSNNQSVNQSSSPSSNQTNSPSIEHSNNQASNVIRAVAITSSVQPDQMNNMDNTQSSSQTNNQPINQVINQSNNQADSETSNQLNNQSIHGMTLVIGSLQTLNSAETVPVSIHSITSPTRQTSHQTTSQPIDIPGATNNQTTHQTNNQSLETDDRLSNGAIRALVSLARSHALPRRVDWDLLLSTRTLAWLDGDVDAAREAARAEEMVIQADFLNQEDDILDSNDHSINQSIDHIIHEPIDPSIDQSAIDPDMLSESETDWSDSDDDMDDSDEEPPTPVNRTTNQSISQSDEPSIKRLIDKIEFKVEEMIDPMTGETMNETTIPRYKPVYHTIPIPPISLESSFHQPINRSINRSNNPPYLITPSHIERGWDYQNIDWRRIHQPRQDLRHRRDLAYPIENAIDSLIDPTVAQSINQSIDLTECIEYFSFASSSQSINPVSFHFQLRHLVHALNNHEVVSLTYEGKIDCLNLLTNQAKNLFDLADYNKIITSIGVVPDTDLMFVGGRDGEYWLVNTGTCRLVIPEQRLTSSEQAITNAITCYDDVIGGMRTLISNNDCFTRCLDVTTLATICEYRRDVPINYAIASPDGRNVLVLGDSPIAWLFDTNSGLCVAELKGHTDHSFSGTWHPNGIEFATASQDCTARIWDIRSFKQSINQLSGRVSPIRSIKYSNDGQFIMFAEAADYMHVRSTQHLERGQLIDCFGEINGFDVSNDNSTIFFGVCDTTYGGIMEWRRQGQQAIDIF